MAKGVHICPLCGEAVDEEDNFCSMCGNRLARELPSPGAGHGEEMAETPQESRDTEAAGAQMQFVFGTTYEGRPETSVLGSFNYIAMTPAARPAPAGEGWLKRCSTGERICLNINPFRMGKKAEIVEYQIRENPTISRHHATITKRDDHYYLSDNHSTNGTFINNVQIHMETELHEGDRVKLSDEEFIFSYL